MKIRNAQKNAFSRPGPRHQDAARDGDDRSGDGLDPQVALDAVADVREHPQRLLPLLAAVEQLDRLALEGVPRGEQEAQIDQHQHGAGGEALQGLGDDAQVGRRVELADDLFHGWARACRHGGRAGGDQGVELGDIADELADELGRVVRRRRRRREGEHGGRMMIADHAAAPGGRTRRRRRISPREAVDHHRQEDRQQQRRDDRAHPAQRRAGRG